MHEADRWVVGMTPLADVLEEIFIHVPRALRTSEASRPRERSGESKAYLRRYVEARTGGHAAGSSAGRFGSCIIRASSLLKNSGAAEIE